ncbi:hypothetical protein [Streptomyces parvulus]|uniref:MFS transporter n=1 Tax=Streptomyces parvulus TaxID=146923 RepID=A0A369VE57_9ACTN|nr:hypothetical protein [Streptomyces parvulus]RDD91081.1 hypothetical protein DVZ84_02370 [Streptomyces parvulus]
MTHSLPEDAAGAAAPTASIPATPVPATPASSAPARSAPGQAGPSQQPVPPRLGRLHVTLPVANIALYLLWFGVGSFLLPLQVARITGTNDTAALSTASTIGAVLATVGNPVFGQLSDLTRSRFGRRAPWILLCALLGALALAGQAHAATIDAVLPLAPDAPAEEWLAHPSAGPWLRDAVGDEGFGAILFDPDNGQMMRAIPLRRLSRLPGLPLSEGQIDDAVNRFGETAV